MPSVFYTGVCSVRVNGGNEIQVRCPSNMVTSLASDLRRDGSSLVHCSDQHTRLPHEKGISDHE